MNEEIKNEVTEEIKTEAAAPEQPVHKRRVRYSGTHPKKYEEKYKELNPEKYAGDVEKIIQSGKTPAGMHIPIMVNEILDFLDIQPGQIGTMLPSATAVTPQKCWKSFREAAISTQRT